MRILIINSEYPPIGGGAGNASANIAREMEKSGQEVCVLTSAFGRLPRNEATGSLRVMRVTSLRRRMDRSGALEQGMFILTGTVAALRLISCWKPDIVIAFFGVPAGPIALFAKLFFKIPYVVSLRGGDVPGFRPYDFGTYHKVIAPLLRLIWRNASAIVANSDGLRKLALSFDDRFPISIIPNGVDLERFTSPLLRSWDPPRLLFVGRIVHQKGLDLLLSALSELKDLPWEMTIVGDGPQREPLREAAANFGLEQRIHFASWRRGADLEAEYGRANLFVFPSRHEGMPNVVLEAMACGLPVIATRIPGNEELVSAGVTGELVPPEDSSAMKGALERLLPDAQLRQNMGSAARKRVEEKYDWANTARQYLSLLEAVGGKS
jgi:glycosyltransferase involved in cell wall biosynthesis